MMRNLRDKKTMQWILWILLGAFLGTIFFAWGMKYTGGSGQRDPNVVAQVGNAQITYADFNSVYRPALDKLYGTKEDGPTQEEMDTLQQEVLDRMVDDAILEQTAQKLGIAVSNEELAGSIQRMPYFLDESGHFDKNRYFQILQANQLNVAQFEDSQRQQILMQKVRSILMEGFLYTNDELDHYASLLGRDLKADYVSFDPTAYEKGITATESDLKDFYEANKKHYDRPERAKVRHILLRALSAEPQDDEKTKALLDGYRSDILSGKSKFGDLAKKYSQDGGSKDKGGELGWITRGEMVKEFEDAAFALKKGEITKPFKTQYGYHIAQLEDYEKAHSSTFAEVRDQVEKQYKKQKAEEKIMALAEKLVNKLKQKESLAKAAKELSLSVNTTAWFNRVSGIPALKNSKDAADELAGLYPRDWKGPMPLDLKEYFFQIVDAREGKAPSTQDRSGLAQRLVSQRQQAWLQDFLDAQRKSLKVKTFLKG